MTDSDKNRVVMAECIARAWQDDSFRQRLVSDPRGTLTEAGMDLPADVALQVKENNADVTYVVLQAGSTLSHKDQVADALEKSLPLNGHEIRIVQNSPSVGYIVIPAKPAQFEEGEMEMAELAGIAGGVAVGYHDVAANVEGVANAVGGTDVAGVTVAVVAGAVVLT